MASMKLPIAKSLILLVMVFAATTAKAQVVVSNPLEWLALAEGNELINDQISSQVDNQTKTAALQNTIAAEFTKIHEWEKKYTTYLQTASGFASSLKASAASLAKMAFISMIFFSYLTYRRLLVFIVISS